MPELAGLLPAAGASRRLGRPKQLVPLGGVPLVRRQAELLLSVTECVIVVTGAHGGAVEAALAGLDVTVRHNPGWADGLAGSLVAGLAAVPDSGDAALVLLCDQYRLQAGDLKALREAWLADPDRICAARWAAGFGPPVILPRAYFADVTRLRGDRGAKPLIAAAGEAARFVDIDGARYDLNTPGDLSGITLPN